MLSPLEDAQIRIVQNWVNNNGSSTWFDTLLTPTNIEIYVMVPSRAHVLIRKLLGVPALAGNLKRVAFPTRWEKKEGSLGS